MLSPHILDRIDNNLADIGAISLDDYLSDGHRLAAPHASHFLAPASEPVTRLHQACRRAFRNTDALKFEFIERDGSKTKRCILTITKPDGAQRSYATQPVFVQKNEAITEAAKIAIDMGALDFLTGGEGDTKPIVPAETSSGGNATSVPSETASETCIDDIEHCCLEWRAGRVTPRWVPFFDAKLAHKQGCALRIRLSSHVARVYLSDPTFDTYSDAQRACAKAAVSESVLEFIKHGNGQTRPSSPLPSASFAASVPPLMTPWTLQGFYDSLPRPFPEFFKTNDASEINAPGRLYSLIQNARGGKLIMSFSFTSDGPPGLHGCLLKLDRPGEYKAFLVDARFLKRSDAKAAVCLQAMSEGIGHYVRSIISAVDTKITPAMRSFSKNLVLPALVSELSKINSKLHPHFEYDKERDAFEATLVVRLSTLHTPEQVRRYTVSSDYRNKADAKAAVVCHAAEQGVVEFVRFQGGTPPAGYTSPYILHTYNTDASRKRKQPGAAEDVEQGRPAKKKRKKKDKRRAEVPSHNEGDRITPVGQYLSVHPDSDQTRGIPGPGDTGLSQSSVSANGSCEPGIGGGSSMAPPAAYSHGTSSYAAVLDPRFAGSGGLGSRGYGVYSLPGAYRGGLYPPPAVDVPLPESGPSRATCSRALRRPAEHAELEPGEVLSSVESEFSESSSRNEEDEVRAVERDTDANSARRSQDKGKGKETSPANTSHVNKLIEYCTTHRCGTPSFYETQREGRFQVWIVIGKERYDLPTMYGTVEEGRERVAKQVLARLSKESSG